MNTKKKKVFMFKDGRWVKWNGKDVDSIIIEEEITLSELRKHFPQILI